MKKTFFFVTLLFSVSAVIAQKNFEGVLTYRNNLVSKSEEISSTTWKKILSIAEEVTITVKDGNFKQVSDKSEVYVFAQTGKAFAKFKGYDTLYVIDVSSDTSHVVSVTKDAGKKMIAGHNCNSIVIKTTAGTYTYFYDPSIYMDPKINPNYNVSREDIFYKETSSLYMSVQEDNNAYTSTQTCTKAEPVSVDAHVFDLPNLPQQQLTPQSFKSSFFKAAQFSGKDWQTFLSKQIDNTVAAKYLKIGRKESVATQTVNVSFMVSETGNVYNVVVDNKKDVHPKLAEEAIRVINTSHWRPATVYGQPIPYKMTQPITFQVTKE